MVQEVFFSQIESLEPALRISTLAFFKPDKPAPLTPEHQRDFNCPFIIRVALVRVFDNAGHSPEELTRQPAEWLAS